MQEYEKLPFRDKINHYKEHFNHFGLKVWPKMSVVSSTGKIPHLCYLKPGLGVYRGPKSEWHKLTAKPTELKVNSAGSVMALCKSNNTLYFHGKYTFDSLLM